MRQKDRTCGNFAATLHGIPDFIIERQMKHFASVNPKLEQGIRFHQASMSKSDEKQETQKDMDRMALSDAAAE